MVIYEYLPAFLIVNTKQTKVNLSGQFQMAENA